MMHVVTAAEKARPPSHVVVSTRICALVLSYIAFIGASAVFFQYACCSSLVPRVINARCCARRSLIGIEQLAKWCRALVAYGEQFHVYQCLPCCVLHGLSHESVLYRVQID